MSGSAGLWVRENPIYARDGTHTLTSEIHEPSWGRCGRAAVRKDARLCHPTTSARDWKHLRSLFTTFNPQTFSSAVLWFIVLLLAHEKFKKKKLTIPFHTTIQPRSEHSTSEQPCTSIFSIHTVIFSTSKFQCCEVLPAKEAYVGFCFRWECPISRSSVARKCIKERELVSSSILFTVISFPSSFNTTSCAAHISQLHK